MRSRHPVYLDQGMNTWSGSGQVTRTATFIPSELSDSHYSLEVIPLDELDKEDMSTPAPARDAEIEVFERNPEGLRMGERWLDRFDFNVKLVDVGRHARRGTRGVRRHVRRV